MARRQTRPPAAQRLILDSGAVIALARGDARARAFLHRAIETDADVRLPVVVLAETIRGGAGDAPIHRLLKAVGEPSHLGGAFGREAGALLGRTGRSDTIDALVVAEAASQGGGHVLTSDPDDLSALAAGLPIVVHSLSRS